MLPCILSQVGICGEFSGRNRSGLFAQRGPSSPWRIPRRVQTGPICFEGLIMDAMKRCYDCGKIKSIDDFHINKRMADGHLNRCKECQRVSFRLSRIVNPEHAREMDHKRNDDPRRKQQLKEKVRKYNERFPERRIANRRVSHALRDGHITRPSACEICGEIRKLQAHHADYSKALEVIWLCAPCHRHIT